MHGIKSWKHCIRCLWAGTTSDEDLVLTQCPNCNNPSLHIAIDDHVYDGKRYDECVRNPKEQATADAALEDVAPLDTDDKSDPGYQSE